MRRRQRAEDGIHIHDGGGTASRRAAIWVAVDKYLPTLEKGIVNLNPFCVPPARAAYTHTNTCVGKRFHARTYYIHITRVLYVSIYIIIIYINSRTYNVYHIIYVRTPCTPQPRPIMIFILLLLLLLCVCVCVCIHKCRLSVGGWVVGACACKQGCRRSRSPFAVASSVIDHRSTGYIEYNINTMYTATRNQTNIYAYISYIIYIII